MSDKLYCFLQQQQELLDSGPEAMSTSSFVFTGPAGGQRKLHSYIRHFRRIRELAGITEDYRPNYCLRDTVASRLLYSGVTLAEVAHQLGHAPGSPMTKRHAKFIPTAQQSIANKAQEAMSSLLEPHKRRYLRRPVGLPLDTVEQMFKPN